MPEVRGTLPGFLRQQLLGLHRQETQAREASRALLRVYLAGAGHDLEALEPLAPVDLDTGAYAYRAAEPPPA